MFRAKRAQRLQSSITLPVRSRPIFVRGRIARQAVHHRRARRDSRGLRREGHRHRSRLRARRQGNRRVDRARRRPVHMPCRICRARKRHRRARARFRRHAAFFVAGPHLRTAHAPDDSAACGESRGGRAARRFGTPVPRGVSHRLRSRVQDGGGHQSDALSERLSLLRNVRDFRRHDQRRQASGAERRNTRATRSRSPRA